MSFPDCAAIARAESFRLDPPEDDHHPDCPEHEDQVRVCFCGDKQDLHAEGRGRCSVPDCLDSCEEFDDDSGCECNELREGDRIAAVEARFDAEREG